MPDPAYHVALAVAFRTRHGPLSLAMRASHTSVLLLAVAATRHIAVRCPDLPPARLRAYAIASGSASTPGFSLSRRLPTISDPGRIPAPPG